MQLWKKTGLIRNYLHYLNQITFYFSWWFVLVTHHNHFDEFTTLQCKRFKNILCEKREKRLTLQFGFILVKGPTFITIYTTKFIREFKQARPFDVNKNVIWKDNFALLRSFSIVPWRLTCKIFTYYWGPLNLEERNGWRNWIDIVIRCYLRPHNCKTASFHVVECEYLVSNFGGKQERAKYLHVKISRSRQTIARIASLKQEMIFFITASLTRK